MEFEFEMWINIRIPIACFALSTFFFLSYFFVSFFFHYPSSSAFFAYITPLLSAQHPNALSLFGSLDNDLRYEIESTDVNKPSFHRNTTLF
jgi:hypothetical protein